jgi:hypothetical protein
MSKKKKSKKNDKALHIADVSKRNPSPPEPPKDREIHLFGFSRHKRD